MCNFWVLVHMYIQNLFMYPCFFEKKYFTGNKILLQTTFCFTFFLSWKINKFDKSNQLNGKIRLHFFKKNIVCTEFKTDRRWIPEIESVIRSQIYCFPLLRFWEAETLKTYLKHCTKKTLTCQGIDFALFKC